MSNRPTPEQIIAEHTWNWESQQTLDALKTHGYRIVHPDDVPESDYHPECEWDDGYVAGFNRCRSDIFGDNHE